MSSAWYYSISRGVLSRPFDDTPLYYGYAGRGPSRDNVNDIDVTAEGPIPTGIYRCLDARDHERLGPVAIPLQPHFTTVTYGRKGFYIHGDNAARDFTASRGCIIVQRSARLAIQSGDILVVIP